MAATTAQTLIAIGTLVIALCFIVCVLYLFLIFRAVKDLSDRIVELSEQIKTSALATMGEVRTSAHAVGRLSKLAVDVARPLLAASLLRGAPSWLRALSVLAGSAGAARQAFRAVTKAAEPPRKAEQERNDDA